MGMEGRAFYIGVDEAGRGPLAGPVAVGAMFASKRMIARFRGIKESKQLTPEERDVWFGRIHGALGDELAYSVSFASAKAIDRDGIVPSIRKSVASALLRLRSDPERVTVLLDGLLKAPPVYRSQKTIIRGDEKRTVIAMASVVAKVLRDRKMEELHLRYPKYGFDRHKGYGTPEHRDAIRAHGLSEEHRRSFCRNI